MRLLLDFWLDRILDQLVPRKTQFRDGYCLFLEYPSLRLNEVKVSALPPRKEENIRVVVVSDTHERHHKLENLPNSDIFVHCGDIALTGRLFSKKAGVRKLMQFNEWLDSIPAPTKLVVAGNHDKAIESLGKSSAQQVLSNGIYLENNSIKIHNITIWGSPLSSGRSPNRAFQSSSFLDETLDSCPSEPVDILITHGPCPDLVTRIPHRLHLWGHLHNSYGVRRPGRKAIFGKDVQAPSVCAPIMDGKFKMSNLPIVIDFLRSSK